MNTVFFFVSFLIICFLVAAVAIMFFHKDAIFTLAIGAVIGANVYNIGNYPIDIGGLTFGMDGVVYCLFLFCLLIMYVEYGKKSAKTLLYTAMFSIFFTALLSAFGNFLNEGSITNNQIWATLSFLFSIVATYVTAIVMFKLYLVFEKKGMNDYLNFILTMIIGNQINSIIYFGLTYLASGALGVVFFSSLFGSVITKVISTALCFVLYVLYEKFWDEDGKHAL